MMTLIERLRESPLVYDAERAAQILASPALREARELASQNQPLRDLLNGVFSASPYLTNLCLTGPDDLNAALTAAPEARLDQILGDMRAAMRLASTQTEAMRILRDAKRRIALLVALADLGGVWGVEEATAALSSAADALVAKAVRFLLRAAAASGHYLPPDPAEPEKQSGYIILAMGKYGAHELNYSSDIDLIAFYDLEAAPLRAGVEPASFFVRLTRDLVKLLSERTSAGYVFRTDLRLRPDPGSTQLALSTSAAFHYYESAGQNWERAAYIKARAAAGDIAAGEAFLAQLAPYVWRKYLDYAAIADIHAMKRQIQAFKGHAQVAVAGHNIKLGRGGIREIEFFVQTQQLIAGGRQPELRASGTLEALTRLHARSWITQETAAELSEAYRFLRRIEHRLQMLNDEQTHTIPEDEGGLRRIANFSSFPDASAFGAALARRLTVVEGHYARLFESVPELTASKSAGSLVFTGAGDDPATVKTLSQMGFASPASVIGTVRGWHFGRYPSTRSAKARERLTEITPALLEAFSQTANPDHALAQFDGFLSDLPAGVQLFALLRNNPGLLRLIADIMGSAPRLARVLSRSRRLFDAVLDPAFTGGLPVAEQWREGFRTRIDGAANYEEALNRARIAGQEQAFLVGVRVLSGAIPAEAAGKAYAGLAEALICVLQEEVEAHMERAHGRVPGGGAAVIAMGKLGGREMTAASDLDLILVYEADRPDALSSGLKPLPASLYYTRFTQRLISALASRTAEGQLYEVDLRLRPSGKAGPVATSLPSFTDYQINRAWTWEHMALTRARAVSGPAPLRASLESFIAAALSAPRDEKKIAASVREMRAKLAAHKNARDAWDLKHARGGLVDIEFIAQYLQLIHANRMPGILRQNTSDALSALRQGGRLTAGQFESLSAACDLYNALTQILRLCVDGPFDAASAPAGIKARLAQAAHAPDFLRLELDLRARQHEAAQLFDAIIPG